MGAVNTGFGWGDSLGSCLGSWLGVAWRRMSDARCKVRMVMSGSV